MMAGVVDTAFGQCQKEFELFDAFFFFVPLMHDMSIAHWHKV